ncbi:MAG: hypothetical protein ACOYBP_07865 [Microbacteriaceae bacterium]
MPRSNRPRNTKRASNDDESDLAYLTIGWRRTETRRGQSWTVQPISEAAAQKRYVCPGCPVMIEPGFAHVVVWRNDGIMGESADLDARRHWHTHCWRVS